MQSLKTLCLLIFLIFKILYTIKKNNNVSFLGFIYFYKYNVSLLILKIYPPKPYLTQYYIFNIKFIFKEL